MLRLCLTAVLLSTTPTLFAQQEADQGAIRDLVQQYVAARNAKSAQATRRLFTADADQLVSSGEWRRGLDALVRGAMASSQRETGTSSIAIESIRFVTADVAIADGRYETSSIGSTAPRKMWTTLIVKRTEAGWRIAAIRNMLPAPPAAPPSK